MSANVEQMFYVSNEENNRFVPWHGLGTPIEAAVSSAEAIKLAGLDWTVEQKPLYIDKVKEIPNYFANVRSTDNSVLGIVGNRYKIVQNSEAFDFTDSLIEEGVVYETAGSLRNGKTIWLLAKMPERVILDDKFDPYICFTNNHDGFGSVRACMTPTRVVCANTLALAIDRATKSWRTSHTGDLKGKLQEAREALHLANLYMDALDKEANILVSQKFSDADYKRALEIMFPVDKDNDSQRKQNNVELAKQNMTVCMLRPDLANFKGTKWQFLQAVADYTSHNEGGRKSETAQENRWASVMNGAPLLNLAYNIVTQ